MSERHVGSVIDTLIGIKDRFKDTLTTEELYCINDTCNLLRYRFDKNDIVDVLVEDHVLTVQVTRSEVGDKLHEKGFLGNDENIDTLITNGLSSALENNMLESIWETIEDSISKHKGELIKR